MILSPSLGGVTLRLAILSRGPRLYSTRRLQEEAIKRGIQTSILDPLQFTLSISKDSPQILHKGDKVNSLKFPNATRLTYLLPTYPPTV